MRKKELHQIALHHIDHLFSEAEKNPEKADRYVAIARKIAMKVELPIPTIYKRRFCKFCNTYFRSGNYRLRIKKKMIIRYCLVCKKYNKFKISH